ncbi:MAG TPA: acyl-CoA dehydrogenase family protein [Acidimicrobiales bacterium]|nr:acyl-CoA dehydrogenase family protein [Acidimicrobiales bacterium]
MNFDFSEEQTALSELSSQIFEGSSSFDRVEEIENTAEKLDANLWEELSAANLLGIAIPEDQGGLGFGLFELCILLEEHGRSVAPIPLLPTLAMGALPIAEFGSEEQKALILPKVIAGDCILTGAYQEWGSNNPLHTSLTAEFVDGKWLLNGSKPAVPSANNADYVIATARTGEEEASLFLIPLTSEGITVTDSPTTNRELHAQLDLDQAEAELLGNVGQGNHSIIWILERVHTAIAAVAVGCCAKATEMMAEYTSEREQFGRPLSHNQAVTQRAADCYIGTDAMRLVLWQAAWRLDAGYPAAEEVRAAKWWSAEIGQKVVHDVQHLHGGMGADVDYPVHRFFLWVKQLENMLGGGSAQLAELGKQIAAKAKAAAGI